MLLRPDAIVASVADVTPEFLRALEVRAVMVDLDDTLIASGSELLEPLFRAWLEQLVEAGFPVVILSNGARARVERWSQDLGVRGLALVGKPFYRAFRRGLKLLGSDPHDTAMVGDQLFTDVLGANLVGLKSVLVSPLSKGKLPHTRALRRLEKRLLRRFRTHKGDGPAQVLAPCLPLYTAAATRAKKSDGALPYPNASLYNLARYANRYANLYAKGWQGWAKRRLERLNEMRFATYVYPHTLRPPYPRLGSALRRRIWLFSR